MGLSFRGEFGFELAGFLVEYIFLELANQQLPNEVGLRALRRMAGFGRSKSAMRKFASDKVSRPIRRAIRNPRTPPIAKNPTNNLHSVCFAPPGLTIGHWHARWKVIALPGSLEQTLHRYRRDADLRSRGFSLSRGAPSPLNIRKSGPKQAFRTSMEGCQELRGR